MSLPEFSDRDAIIAELHARLAKAKRDVEGLETAIAVVESLRPAGSQPRILAADQGIQTAPSIGTYSGLTALNAAIKFLEMRGDDADSNTIAEALRVGGFETKSERFANMLHGILNRDLKKNPKTTLVRFRKRWGLKTWKRAKSGFVVHPGSAGAT